MLKQDIQYFLDEHMVKQAFYDQPIRVNKVITSIQSSSLNVF